MRRDPVTDLHSADYTLGKAPLLARWVVSLLLWDEKHQQYNKGSQWARQGAESFTYKIEFILHENPYKIGMVFLILPETEA